MFPRESDYRKRGSKSMTSGDTQGRMFFCLLASCIHDQCFLNLFTVSMPLHHPLQPPATREDTATQVHPQTPPVVTLINPDTTICPITRSVRRCLRPPRTSLSFDPVPSPQLVAVKRRIASRSCNPRLSPSRDNGFYSFQLTCFVFVLSYF